METRTQPGSLGNGDGHPERFDPADHGGRLMEAEHRGRYWWAAQIAAGKDVLDAACGTGYGMTMLVEAGARSVVGVDLDPEAVAAAGRRCGDPEAVRRGDVRELPFETDSFDLVVCWETIEHVEDGEAVVAEFRRVLRPDGILLVSSPNPAVYPAGNEHHVHEYRPEELAALVRARFSQVSNYGQHPWLASAIGAIEDGSNGASASNGHRQIELRTTKRLRAGEQTYGIVAASDAPLPAFDRVLVLGGDFEVRWWVDRVEAAGREAREAVRAVEVEAQRLLGEAAAREAALRARLDETASALYEANQTLAQMPVLRHQASQARVEAEELRATYEGSSSWRLTAPMRRFAQMLRNRRR